MFTYLLSFTFHVPLLIHKLYYHIRILIHPKFAKKQVSVPIPFHLLVYANSRVKSSYGTTDLKILRMKSIMVNEVMKVGKIAPKETNSSWMPSYVSTIQKVKYERRLLATSTLKVDEVLHMEGGYGDASYANNSFVQKRIIAKSRPILKKTIEDLCSNMMPECLTVAELGCSSGPNAFDAISEIIKVTSNLYKCMNLVEPEYKVFLNDLLGNDFNTLFRSFPKFRNNVKKGNFGSSIFMSGMPGSFHGRLFPSSFLHLVHASSSVHFLSEVPKALMRNGIPLNKGAICLTKKSPLEVHEAYYQQFAKDFALFLSSRSIEVVPGGRLVLTFRISTISDKPDYIWDFDFLGMALRAMVLEGKLEEEKLDSFNMPFFTPCVEQVKRLVEDNGSFTINNMETFTVDWGLKDTDLLLALDNRANLVCSGYRAATGPILAAQFGKEAMDELFCRFKDLVKESLVEGKLEILNLVISMTRK